ncbi:hypothetical protein FH972_010124 [Carpinus fangiana]|uniref:Uncharacterized protein n=1 Tax=Carpinus fangiana TaxID=176857 RepID=A0A660KMD4_9ROSI|nr:hypothetical protein FH972_010124 [Carpinus fangiana]
MDSAWEYCKPAPKKRWERPKKMLGIVIPAFVVTARKGGVGKPFCRHFERVLVKRIPRTASSTNAREGRFAGINS